MMVCPLTLKIDLNALPGCNPNQNGPSTATIVSNCNAISTTIDAPAGTPVNPVPTTSMPVPTTSVPIPTTSTPIYVPPPVPTTSTPIYVPPPVPTTSTPVVQPPPPAPQQTKWGQCGGCVLTNSTLFSVVTHGCYPYRQGWNGPTQCQPPATCQAQNQWYSQVRDKSFFKLSN